MANAGESHDQGEQDAAAGKDYSPPWPMPGISEKDLEAARTSYDKGYYHALGQTHGKELDFISPSGARKIFESPHRNNVREEAYKVGYETTFDKAIQNALEGTTTSEPTDRASRSYTTHGGSGPSYRSPTSELGLYTALHLTYLLPVATLGTLMLTGGEKGFTVINILITLIPLLNWLGVLGALIFTRPDEKWIVITVFLLWVVAPLVVIAGRALRR